MHFATFPTLRFQKAAPTFFMQFHAFQVMESMILGGGGGVKDINFCDTKKIIILWHFEIFVNTGPYGGLKISKRCSSYSFHLMSAHGSEDIGYHEGIQAVTFLSNQIS